MNAGEHKEGDIPENIIVMTHEEHSNQMKGGIIRSMEHLFDSPNTKNMVVFAHAGASKKWGITVQKEAPSKMDSESSTKVNSKESLKKIDIHAQKAMNYITNMSDEYISMINSHEDHPEDNKA